MKRLLALMTAALFLAATPTALSNPYPQADCPGCYD